MWRAEIARSGERAWLDAPHPIRVGPVRVRFGGSAETRRLGGDVGRGREWPLAERDLDSLGERNVGSGARRIEGLGGQVGQEGIDDPPVRCTHGRHIFPLETAPGLPQNAAASGCPCAASAAANLSRASI